MFGDHILRIHVIEQVVLHASAKDVAQYVAIVHNYRQIDLAPPL